MLVGPALVTGEGHPAVHPGSLSVAGLSAPLGTPCAQLMLQGAHLGSAGDSSQSLSCLLGDGCDSWTGLIAHLS